MKEIIDTGLPALKQPFSWAVKSSGMLFTAHGPVRADATIDTGSIEDQARLTFANLQRALVAAGDPPVPRNAGNNRTASKRALLKAIEEAGGKW